MLGPTSGAAPNHSTLLVAGVRASTLAAHAHVLLHLGTYQAAHLVGGETNRGGPARRAAFRRTERERLNWNPSASPLLPFGFAANAGFGRCAYGHVDRRAHTPVFQNA